MPGQGRNGREVLQTVACQGTIAKKEVIEATTKGKKEVKKLTDEEMREHIKKGMCFKCGEKWGVGHKCTTQDQIPQPI